MKHYKIDSYPGYPYPEYYDSLEYPGYCVVNFPNFLTDEPPNIEHLAEEWDEHNRCTEIERIEYFLRGYYPAFPIPYERKHDSLYVISTLTEEEYGLCSILIDWKKGGSTIDSPRGFYPPVPVIPVFWEYWVYEKGYHPMYNKSFSKDEYGFFKQRLLFIEDFDWYENDEFIEQEVNKWLNSQK